MAGRRKYHAAEEKRTARLEAQRRYRERHPERCYEAQRRWREANPEKVKEFSRRRVTDGRSRADKDRWLYGLPTGGRQALLAAQSGVCAICRSPEHGGRNWHVDDHSHATLKVRGILCHKCNFLLGAARDDTAILEAAAAYLRAHAVET